MAADLAAADAAARAALTAGRMRVQGRVAEAVGRGHRTRGLKQDDPGKNPHRSGGQRSQHGQQYPPLFELQIFQAQRSHAWLYHEPRPLKFTRSIHEIHPEYTMPSRPEWPLVRAI
jgi:hypothetical protein